QKLEHLLESAYKLFLTKGIEKTSVSDIVKGAGVAKGTFYLYFKDKYEIRDGLISHTSGKLFTDALVSLSTQDIPLFEERIIFIVDHILDALSHNHSLLKFISKNLSWGIFKQALTSHSNESDVHFLDIYHKMLADNQEYRLKDPEIMLFMIVELASSTCHSTILYQDPIRFLELKPYLNECIRFIIHQHADTQS
ncbi:MAG: TetR/AcrR family transcriptional regulator, partial [Lachnospiraceae bacterium]